MAGDKRLLGALYLMCANWVDIRKIKVRMDAAKYSRRNRYMVVQHNLTAMNSNRMLGLTTASQAKSTEKLSSGYKINRAADDAAGLSISEKMRKQIRGLTQASANAQDGISAVQTAEGALTEVHDMLQRMNELAVKAANGTNSVDDRQNIQDEIDQLVTEIDRVAETTKFNETYLLKGDKSADATDTLAYKPLSALYDENGNKISANGLSSYIKVDDADNFSFQDNKEIYYKDSVDGYKLKITPDTHENLNGYVSILEDTGIAALDVSLHVGADATTNNQITMKIDAMDATSLGIQTETAGVKSAVKVTGKTDTNALDAIETIKAAIQKVSTQRSSLGAVQNRLEHTINNLDNVVENTTAAESQIRDTDMAKEMVKYSNNNILAQAGQAMLAQANQTNQGVLSLIQ